MSEQDKPRLSEIQPREMTKTQQELLEAFQSVMEGNGPDGFLLVGFRQVGGEEASFENTVWWHTGKKCFPVMLLGQMAHKAFDLRLASCSARDKVLDELGFDEQPDEGA